MQDQPFVCRDCEIWKNHILTAFNSNNLITPKIGKINLIDAFYILYSIQNYVQQADSHFD